MTNALRQPDAAYTAPHRRIELMRMLVRAASAVLRAGLQELKGTSKSEAESDLGSEK